MFCPKCGTKNSSKSQFCVKCGRALQPEETGDQTPAPGAGFAPPPSRAKRSPVFWIILGVVGLVLVAAIIWGAIALTNRNAQLAQVIPTATQNQAVMVTEAPQQPVVTQAPPQPVETQAPIDPEEPITFSLGDSSAPVAGTNAQYQVINVMELGYHARISPGAVHIASPSGGNVNIYSVPGLTLERTLQGGVDELAAISFSPNNTLLAGVDTNSVVRIWRLSDGTLLYTFTVYGYEDAPWVEFIDNTRLAYMGYFSRSMFVWDVTNGTIVLDLSGQLTRSGSEVFSADSRYMAEWSNFDLGVYLMDLATGTWFEDAYASHSSEVTCAAFDPRTEILASGSYDATLQLWGLNENRLLLTLQHSEKITNVFFSSDGNIIYSFTKDGVGWIWNWNDVLLYKVLFDNGSENYATALSPDGRLLAVGQGNGQVWIVDAYNGAVLQKLYTGETALMFIEFTGNSGHMVLQLQTGKIIVLESY
jgi:WD40 repeat protein